MKPPKPSSVDDAELGAMGRKAAAVSTAAKAAVGHSECLAEQRLEMADRGAIGSANCSMAAAMAERIQKQ